MKQDGLHCKEETWESSAGRVLVVLRNLTPEIGGFRGTEERQMMFQLTPDSFGRGDYKYDLTIDPVRVGRVSLQPTVLPFLAPLRAQVVRETANGGSKRLVL